MTNPSPLPAISRNLDMAMAMLPIKLDSIKARALVMKIVLQESLGIYRDQLERDGRNTVLGPALGLAQFERGGACTSLLNHAATRPLILSLLKAFDIRPTADAFWRALPANDVLALAAARVNLYWLPQALPAIDNANEGFEQYLAAWRPGAWSRGTPEKRQQLRHKWNGYHAQVNEFLRNDD